MENLQQTEKTSEQESVLGESGFDMASPGMASVSPPPFQLQVDGNQPIQAQWAVGDFSQPHFEFNPFKYVRDRAKNEDLGDLALQAYQLAQSIPGQSARVQALIRDLVYGSTSHTTLTILQEVIVMLEEEQENDTPESAEADHPIGSNAEEKIAQIEDVDVRWLRDNREEQLLFNIFANLARSYGFSYSYAQMWGKYERWLHGGVFTRESFQRMLAQDHAVGQSEAMQLARTPGSISTKDKYNTRNFGQFENVEYKLDGGGNIDFSSTHNAPKKWADPVDHGSKIELTAGCKKAKHGLMPSGFMVCIPDASRSQHFAIGDRMNKTDAAHRKGKWTWHHLSNEYEMILVDMAVHAKHGHNGGVYLWK